MAYATFNLVVRERSLDGLIPTRVSVVVTPLAGTDGTVVREIKDTSGDLVLSGAANVSVSGAGTEDVTVNLPDPRDDTLIPTGFGYQVHVSTNYSDRPVTIFGPTELDNHATDQVLYLEDVTDVAAASFDAGASYATSADLAEALAAAEAYTDAHAGGGGGTTPDATTTVKGKVQLAGDLAGTAAAPTVPALSSKASTTALNAEITRATAAETAAITPDATSTVKGKLRLAGDLGGTANTPTVPGLVALTTKVAKWQPSTTYLAGDAVMAPDGSVVERLVDGTSGSTYESLNWQTVATVPGTQENTELTSLYLPRGEAPDLLSAVTDDGDIGGTSTGGGGTPPPITTIRHLEHSFWRTPLASGATLASTSANMVSRITYQATMSKTSTPVAADYNPPYTTQVQNAAFAYPVYVMDPATPRVPVWQRATTKPDFQVVLDAGVPVPDPSQIPDGLIQPSGSDGSVVIICGNELWELFKFGPAVPGTDPTGYVWKCQQGGYMANYHTHPGWWAAGPAFGGGSGGRPQGTSWGVSAAGNSRVGGLLTAEDYYGDAIAHPLLLGIPITGGDGSDPPRLLPATRFDERQMVATSDLTVIAPYRVPEGIRFRLPTSFDIETWATAHARATADVQGTTVDVLRKVLIAIRDYGMFVIDSAGVITFAQENPKTFGTRYNPYAANQVPNWGNFGQQIPWSSLQQLAVPTTDISVPGGS